jgi:hypothetical protein
MPKLYRSCKMCRNEHDGNKKVAKLLKRINERKTNKRMAKNK